MQQALLDALLANESPPDHYNAIERSLAALAALPDGDDRLVLYRCVGACFAFLRFSWCLCVCASNTSTQASRDDDDDGDGDDHAPRPL